MRDMTLIKECEGRITKAKTALIIRHYFFAIIACKLKFLNAGLVGVGHEVRTMAVDGKHCFWDENFVAKLTKEELMGVICHEVMHIVLLHIIRLLGRDPLVWNWAGDFVINLIVEAAGLTLPKDRLYDAKYKDWNADRVYDDLMKNPPPQQCLAFFLPSSNPGGDGDKDGKGKTPLWGTVMTPRNSDGTEMSEADKAELIEEIKITVKQAAESAKSMGKLPAGLESLVEALGKPSVNWHDYVPSWIKGQVPDDYTWRRPNRTIMANYGIYMPRMEVRGAGCGVLTVDNSGSVSNRELVKYVTETVGLIEQCKPDKLYIIQHDSKVQKVDVWESGDDFSKLLIKGRGGTCIRPVYDYIGKEIDEPIDWMIHFTDMGIYDMPKAHEAPDFPVLWAATGPDNTPYGTYLPLKDAIEQVA